MNYIIYDLEFTVLRTQQYLSEIIEIGAIKVQEIEDQLVMGDLFHSYVSPSRNRVLSPLTTEFTGITQDKINQAPTFPHAIRDFITWLGEEDYYLCSWGLDDKLQFIKHSREHGVDLHWIRNTNDIQHQFSLKHAKNGFHQVGLKKALDLLEINFVGTPHNALDDAFNTAKVFKRIFPQLQLNKNDAADEQVYATKVVYQTDQEEANYPFRQLDQLLRDLSIG
ncbi:MAG TPA: 3'-5' exonuclease [Bacillota bacterium]|nr:3'-5' exonuclease [Bacillota bacterium]